MFNTSLITAIKEKLTAKAETLAVAESVTAGFLQAAIASAESASDFFQAGLTVYNIGQKCRHLDIDPVHAERCNCVSERMARDMATSVCHRFTSQWGLAVTGYATPTQESGNGIFAYFSIAKSGREVLTARIDGGEAKGQDVQLRYVETILSEFLNQL